MFDQFALDERILKVLPALGFSKPTPIQTAMIPKALEGRDIQASADTGTGKTAAFLLPILQRLHNKPQPKTDTRCLIVLPTRELAGQIYQNARDLAAYTQLQADLVVGGSGFREQQAALRKNPEIIIGTPGRLVEHLEKGSLLLADVEVLVLDEADRMLDMGFREDVMKLVKACNAKRQTMLLSATLHHSGIGKIASEVLKSPQIIDLASTEEQQAAIRQQIILADDNGHKRQLISWLLANEPHHKALIFTNTREHAEQLYNFLYGQKGGTVACLHGEMVHEERQLVMRGFRDGRFTTLVATDLAARGLDVKGVELVINFAMARSGDDYVHRIGRTGRAGASGLAISLISAQDWNPMQSVARYLQLEFEKREVESLPARFKGGVKSRKKKDAAKTNRKKPAAAKSKERHRNRKNIGKRRETSKQKAVVDAQGLAPLKKK